MVKKRSESSRHQGQRLKASAKKHSNDNEALQTSSEDLHLQPAKRLQRKVTKRVNFLENVAKSHKLSAQPGIRKKRSRKNKATGAALGDLSGLADALGWAERDLDRKQEKQHKGLGVGGAKTRRKLAGKETVRLQKVLAHPQFQQNPLAAVAEHLKATLPAEEAVKKPRKNVSGSQKQKLKRQKARLESEMES